jgi:DNA-binding transcriptional MerR regulator
MKILSTNDVAERAGVNIHTVRYYEQRGLLPEPPRTPAGYRKYGQEHVAHIRFIKRAQDLGFTLEEIRELLDLRAVPDAGADVRAKTEEKVQEIDGKIHDLQRIRAKLVELAGACEKHGSQESCLVLHALEEPQTEPDLDS